MEKEQPNRGVDVESLLNELENEEVPAMTAEFESQAMSRIVRRKEELDAEEEKPGATRAARTGWKAWLAIAAVFVFLIGGTLLTRDSLRPRQAPDLGSIGISIINPVSRDPLGSETVTVRKDPAETGGAALFMEDMGRFVVASLPYLAGAGVLAGLLYLVIQKRKSPK